MTRFLAIAVAVLWILVPASSVRADDKADALLKQVAAVMKATRTLTADFSISTTMRDEPRHQSGSATLMKPNYLREDLWTGNEANRKGKRYMSLPHKINASDGNLYWDIKPDGTYKKTTVDVNGHNLENDTVPLGFFNPDSFREMSPYITFQYAGTQPCSGVPCDVVTLSANSQTVTLTSPKISGRIYIGRDHIIRRIKFSNESEGYIDVIIKNVKVGVHLLKADFAFKKPAFARIEKKNAPEITPAANIEAPKAKMDKKSKELLLKVAHTMRITQTLTADYTDTTQYHWKTGKVHNNAMYYAGYVKLMKPNFARAEHWQYSNKSMETGKQEKYSPNLQVSNGATYWDLWDMKRNYFETQPIAADGHDIPLYYVGFFSDFLTPPNLTT